MKRRVRVSIAAVCACIFMGLIFCVISYSNVKINNVKIDISDGWEYSLYSPVNSLHAEFKTLPDDMRTSLHKLVPGEKGFLYLRNSFSVPPVLQGRDLSCYLGRISMADYTTINGTYIGGKGSFPPHMFSAWNAVRNYSVSEAMLHPGENEILIKLYVEGEGVFDSSSFIGLQEDVTKVSDREEFVNSKIYLLFAFFMVIISGYYFVMFFMRKRDKENLMFGIINIFSSFYMIVFCINEMPGFPPRWISFLLFQKIFSSALPFLLAFFVTSFIDYFVGRKEHYIALIARIIFAFVPIFAILVAPDYIHLVKIRVWTNAFLVPAMIYMLYIIISSVIKKRRDTLVLLAGFSPVVLCVILDYIMHNYLSLNRVPYITGLGWQLAIVAFLIILATRFSNALNESEYLNQHLENEVKSRTQELSVSNDKLTNANKALETARDMAERDMKLAVYVQQSFYRQDTSSVTDWDIAYYFNPAAGVSGDLYDFFIHDGKLEGLGLFDVSGHGIASGLVTMLAKNTIDRKFEEGKNKPFSKVMTEISDEIVKEKGDIENYLTGLLLRITGNKVEYINAGHPKMFCRLAKTGEVMPVELKDSSTSGGLIGVAGLPVEFKVLSFKMNKGDALIMYTDCLNEMKNISGEEFGTDRIKQAFGDASGNSAKEKLNSVLNTFSNYTKGAGQKDDLTVIVLQKK